VALLTLNNITLAFGGAPVFDGINCQIETGDRFCLMGRNGSGKSTLLRIMSGEILPESGEITRKQGLKTALVSQEIPKGIEGTVFDVVASGVGNSAKLLADYHNLANRLASETDNELIEELEELQHKLETSEAWSLHQNVEQLLKRLSLEPDKVFSTLSGGTKRRVLLAKALASEPDILLLDEPTNHLDIDTIIWLEEFLGKNVKTFLFVTHDRAFARKLANRVAELDRGRIYSFKCGYDEFVTRREELLTAEITRQALFDKKLAQEESWIRQGIKARRTRNEGRVRALEKMREERRQRRNRTGEANMKLLEAGRSGALVAEANKVSFGFPGNPIVTDFTGTIMRGDRIGIIGPNGVGKTTLLRLLLGELQPEAGEIKLGSRREVIYFDQLREQLDPDKSVIENVGEGNDSIIINGKSRHIIGYLQDFLFFPDRARTPVGILSGGERNRLLLAKLFMKPSNILVMDEPTNDLDAETLDLLEDMLIEYSGTLLLVSHDREFLNNVVTSTLVMKGDGKVQEFVGGYDDWLRQAGPTDDTENKKRVSEKPKQQKERPRKLNFKEERELEELPERITILEREQNGLHTTLGDPAFYKESGEEVVNVNKRLEETESELVTLYKRWEELENIKNPAM